MSGLNLGLTRNGNTFQVWFGKRFYLCSSSGYWVSPRFGRAHRWVWRNIHGDIPSNHHVHHIDGDKGNNRIENLQILMPTQHAKLHFSKVVKYRQVIGTSTIACETVKKSCEGCHSLFEVAVGHGARIKFCCAKCKYASKNRKAIETGRYNVTTNCVFCNKKFETDKYRPKACCSVACANRLKAVIRRAKSLESNLHSEQRGFDGSS